MYTTSSKSIHDGYFDVEQFKHFGKETIDLVSSELIEQINDHSVYPNAFVPGTIRKELPNEAPEDEEQMDHILADTKKYVFHNVLSWHHPKNFGCMPSTLSHGAVLADMIGLVLNNPQHSYSINPAGTELENLMTDWCAKAFNLPSKFLFEKSGGGIIYNSIGEGNLLVVHSAKFKKMKELGIHRRHPKTLDFVAYHSSHCHYSTPRALGLIQIPVIKEVPVTYNPEKKKYEIDIKEFEKLIKSDIEEGLIPFFFGATIGATATGAADPISKLVRLCQKYKMWLNVDAAWAGASFICKEYYQMYGKGLEGANSIAINMGKWLFTGMCAAIFWIDDKEFYQESLAIEPIYLKNTNNEKMINFKDWTISTRRRFNSLRIWFVMRSIGLKKIRQNIENNCNVAAFIEKKIKEHDRLELFIERELSLVCFRIKKDKKLKDYPEDQLNDINKVFREKVISSGEFYFVGSQVEDVFFLRFIVNNPSTDENIAKDFWEHLSRCTDEFE